MRWLQACVLLAKVVHIIHLEGSHRQPFNPIFCDAYQKFQSPWGNLFGTAWQNMTYPIQHSTLGSAEKKERDGGEEGDVEHISLSLIFHSSHRFHQTLICRCHQVWIQPKIYGMLPIHNDTNAQPRPTRNHCLFSHSRNSSQFWQVAAPNEKDIFLLASHNIMLISSE